jgi:predicted nucleic acid-binding protein
MRADVVVFDTYAWVEYALDGPKAEIVAQQLALAAEALTPATVLGELKEALLRHRIAPKKIAAILNFVRGRTLVVEITADITEKAGEVNCEHKQRIEGWGMMDSLVYAVTVVRHAKVITGDPHFQGLADVIYIGE